MLVKCVIIDDELMSRTLLSALIKKDEEMQLLKEFEDPTMALNYIKTTKVDLVFLDIEMPQMTGIEFIRLLKDQSPNIILTTSHSDFAIEAFNYNVSGYLLKPVRFDMFYNATEKVKHNIQQQKNNGRQQDQLFIKSDGTVYNLKFAEINWVESMGDYLSIHTDAKKYIIHSTMKNFFDRLPEKDFIRVHRSFILRF